MQKIIEKSREKAAKKKAKKKGPSMYEKMMGAANGSTPSESSQDNTISSIAKDLKKKSDMINASVPTSFTLESSLWIIELTG